MNEWQENWILEKTEELHKLIEMKHLMLIDLQARKILNQGDIDELKRVKHHVEDGVSVEKSTFLTKLKAKDCYDILIEVFEKHLLTGAVKVLRTGRDTNTKEVDGNKEELHKKEEPNPSSAEDEEFDKLIKADLNFINKRDPFTVNVHKPKHQDSLPESNYPSTAGGKRIFLLVNVIEYNQKLENPPQKRVGAGVDTRRLKELWEGLGWKVITVGVESAEYPEGGYIKKKDVTDAIDKVNKLCQDEWVDVDAIAVYVSSHGSHNGFYTSEREFIHIYDDIIYQFDHKRCPRMEGKPKLFFHNACAVFSSNPEECAKPRLEPEVAWDAPKADKIADAILIRANIPGALAYLHPNKGTQLGVALTLVFMYFAWKLDFDQLMQKIDHYFEGKHIVANTKDQFIQRPHLEPFWLKKFCLFRSKE